MDNDFHYDVIFIVIIIKDIFIIINNKEEVAFIIDIINIQVNGIIFKMYFSSLAIGNSLQKVAREGKVISLHSHIMTLIKDDHMHMLLISYHHQLF